MTLIHRLSKMQRRNWIRSCAIACGFLVALCLIFSPTKTNDLQVYPAWGQSDNPGQAVAPENKPTPTNKQIPIFGLRQELKELLPPRPAPEIESGAVRLDGRSLFYIGAPAVDQRPFSMAEPTPIQQRVREIQQRLSKIARSIYDAETIEVILKEGTGSEPPILYIKDETFGDDEEGAYLMSVTLADAQANGYGDNIAGVRSWARELKNKVEEGLHRFKQERQPDFLRRQSVIAGGVLLSILIASWSIRRFRRYLRREWNRLRTQLSDRLGALTHASASASDADDSTDVTTALQQEMESRQRRTLFEIGRLLLGSSQLIIWIGGLFLISGLFPYSRWLQRLLVVATPVPLKLLVLVLGTQVMIRLGAALVDRCFFILQNRLILSPKATQRTALRFSTFSQVSKNVLAALFVGIAFLIGLAMIGIQVAPLLAGAGVIGLGISFASQGLIKDFINGFFILLEDQYGVGDIVVIGDVDGLVENMNLRITQLRNTEGRLITIPNSSITVVQNLSKEWSRVDLMIDVARSANIDQALALVDQVAQTMSRDSKWRALILESPLLLGVDKLDYMGATIRLWIKTQPLKQWEVAREYRRRLKIAFDQAGIEIGIPQQLVSFQKIGDGELAKALATASDGQENLAQSHSKSET